MATSYPRGVIESLQSLLHGQEIAANKSVLPEWADIIETLAAAPLPPADNVPPSAIAGGGSSIAAPGTSGGGPGALAARLGPHPSPQTAGLGVAGYAQLVASSVDTGLSLTPLPADRMATTIIFNSGVFSLKGERPEDIEERTAAKANAILTGSYAGEVDNVVS